MSEGPIVRTKAAYVPRDFEDNFFQKARAKLGYDALLGLYFDDGQKPPFFSAFPSLPSFVAPELGVGSGSLELFALTSELSVQMDGNRELLNNQVSHFFIFGLFPLVESYDTFYPRATVDWVTEDTLSQVRSIVGG